MRYVQPKRHPLEKKQPPSFILPVGNICGNNELDVALDRWIASIPLTSGSYIKSYTRFFFRSSI